MENMISTETIAAKKRLSDLEFIQLCRREADSKSRDELAELCGMTVSAFNVRHSNLNALLRKAVSLTIATETTEDGTQSVLAEYDSDANTTTFALDAIKLDSQSLASVPDKVRELYTWRKTESGRIVVDQTAEIVSREPGVVVVRGKVIPCEVMTCGNSIPAPDGRGQGGRKATPKDVNELLSALL